MHKQVDNIYIERFGKNLKINRTMFHGKCVEQTLADGIRQIMEPQDGTKSFHMRVNEHNVWISVGEDIATVGIGLDIEMNFEHSRMVDILAVIHTVTKALNQPWRAEL